jgi:hypothetical protein
MNTNDGQKSRCNEQYAIDSTQAEVYLRQPSKESPLPIRPWIHMIVDQHSRLIVGVDVSFKPLNKRKLMAMVKATRTSQL